jgi:hypothetical protein
LFFFLSSKFISKNNSDFQFLEFQLSKRSRNHEIIRKKKGFFLGILTWFFGAFSLPHYRNYRCRRNYPAGTGSGTSMLTAPSGSMTAITSHRRLCFTSVRKYAHSGTGDPHGREPARAATELKAAADWWRFGNRCNQEAKAVCE